MKRPNAYSFPTGKLIVIIRDDSPFTYLQASPSYRSVTIALTEEQLVKLRLRHTGTLHGEDTFEEIDRCFLEPRGEGYFND